MAIANGGAAQNYDPVRAAGSAPQGLGYGDPGLPIEGMAGCYDPRGTDDDYTQAGDLFRLLPSAEKEKLFVNIANAMRGVPREIQERQLVHFYKADPAYGEGVRSMMTL